MRTLLIIRHAKSDQRFWGNDFERPLNERGKTDAPAMAKRLLAKRVVIDAFIASPATRAKRTAELFCHEYKVPGDTIQFVTALYHAQPEVYYQVVSQLDDHIQHAAIFSHNPGISVFVNQLTNTRIDNMPTCSIFAIQTDCNNWAGFLKSKKEFLFFDYPKNLQG